MGYRHIYIIGERAIDAANLIRMKGGRDREVKINEEMNEYLLVSFRSIFAAVVREN